MEKIKKSILIFTDKYPYGHMESFISQELEMASKYFEKVAIFPLEKDHGRNLRPLPSDVLLFEPIYSSLKNKKELILKGLFNLTGIGRYFSEFYRCRVFLSVHKFQNWLAHFLLTRYMRARMKNKNIQPPIESYDILYFYWGLRWSQILPFYNPNHQKIIVRFHGSDLYNETNHQYIPFREKQLNQIDLHVFVSELGRTYLINHYGQFIRDTYVGRLGTRDGGISPYTKDGVLSLVTCSNILPLKQLEIVARALKFINSKVKWTHIGDGPLKDEIVALAKESNKEAEIQFLGQLSNSDLFSFYQKEKVDLFLNVSKSEGVPVTVMEALSFGIPVIASKVGGTSEIVDEEVGALISPNIKPEELAQTIFKIYDQEEYLSIRKNARKRWESRCVGETQFRNFFEKIATY